MLDLSSDDYLTSRHFTPRERAAVLWAEHVARNTAVERDDIFQEVKQHFSDAELIELTASSGQFASSNRFQDSLCVPLEEQSEVNKIKRSLRVDPNHIKTYIENLLEYWPREFPRPSVPGRDITPGETGKEPPAATAFPDIAGEIPRLTSRVLLLTPERAEGETARFFHAADQLLGGLTNVIRMWAHIPHVAKLFLPFHAVLEHEGAGSILPLSLKILVLIRTGHLNSATYSLAHRSALGRGVGIAEDKFEALNSKGCSTSPFFSPRERAALLWAEHVASNTAIRRDDVFDELKNHFNDTEIVELTASCALANQEDRICNALHLPVEAELEVNRLNRMVQLDPGRVKHYLETLIAQWPTEFLAFSEVVSAP